MMDCIPILDISTANFTEFGLVSANTSTLLNTSAHAFNSRAYVNDTSHTDASPLVVDLSDPSNDSFQGHNYANEENFAKTFERILYGRVIVAISIFGIIGNCLNLVVLTRKGLQKTMDRMEKSAHYGLVALAMSDLLVCLVIFPHAWVDTSLFAFDKLTFDILYIIYENGVINAFMMASTWLTVAMATSRYLAICHPLRARQIIGMTFAKASIFLVFIVCIIFNLPRFWTKTLDQISCEGGWSAYFIGEGPMLTKPGVEYYYLWCYFVFGILIPILLLAFCNVQLILALRRSSKMRAQYQNPHSTSNAEQKHQITLTLIIIVIMYFLLVLPAEIINFWKQMFTKPEANTNGINVGVAIVNTLQAFAFASNFILYCFVNASFRRAIMEMITCGRHHHHSNDGYSQTKHTSMYTQRTSCASV